MAFVMTGGTLIESYEDRSQNLATAELVGNLRSRQRIYVRLPLGSCQELRAKRDGHGLRHRSILALVTNEISEKAYESTAGGGEEIFVITALMR